MAERSTIEDLPPELLILASKYIPPRDLMQGLARTNRSFYQLFTSDDYWKERLRGRSRDYCKHLSLIDGEFAWIKRVELYEQISDTFRPGRHRRKFLGEDIQQALGNFQRLEFGDHGRFLAFCTKDRLCTMVWNLDGLLRNGERPDMYIYDDHDQKLTSLSAKDNYLSSGAWDGTISIRDLNAECKKPLQILCSTGLVAYHNWTDDTIISGTRGGAIEIFDIRAGEDPQLREMVFATTEVCNDFKMQRRCHDVILAGWDLGVRKLKLFDLRNEQVVNETEIGTWNLSMHHADNMLWIGADKGRVLLYDPDSLELVKDYTAACGHLSNVGWLREVHFLESVRSILYSNGHLFTADLRQVKVHDIHGPRPKLRWEHEIVFSELAFCEERCILAAAEGHTPDQIRLMYRSDL